MIVKMKHLDLVCVAADRSAMLEKLRALGVMHLNLSAGDGTSVAAAKGAIDETQKAVRLILKARGKSFSEEIRPATVADVLALDEDRAKLCAERERLEREIKKYAPYGDFDPELARRLLEKGVEINELLPATLPEMRLSRMIEKSERIENRIAIDTAKIARTDEKAILAKSSQLRERMEFEQAKALMEEKGAVAVVSGWVPAGRDTALYDAAKENGWGLLVRDPIEGETPPTLIEPPKFVRPVKALFEGLGIAPAYDEADVSVPFMAYFSLFFAMLVGDGGYGAIFLALTLIFRRRLTKSWLVLMSVFSLATIAWGALSNTWFGAQIPWCADWRTVTWLAGEGAAVGHEYDNMMFLCFTIGVTHLVLARLWNAFCTLNDRACLSQFGWAGIILFMYVLTNSIVGIFSGVPTWCYWVFGVSFLTVFVQSKGMEKGMLFLNVMSVLGDIISYVRLFAVGLASVKVAQNFNSMAIELALPVWIKWLPLVLVMLVGHALNLAMAGLSVLVHAVRLNTLEFSNHKSISWSGFSFKPFTKIKEK